MDTEYIMSCTVELGELTPLESTVLYLHPEVYALLRGKVDRQEAIDKDWLANTCRHMYQSAPKAFQQFAGVFSLLNPVIATYQQERLIESVYQKVRNDLGINPNKRYQELLGMTTDSPKRFDSWADVNESSVREFLDQECVSMRNRFLQDIQDLGQTREALNGHLSQMMLGAQQQADLLEECAALPATAVRDVDYQRKLFAKSRGYVKAAKQAIKRAVNLFQVQGKGDVLMHFMAGQVEISHPESDLKFMVRPLKKDWLITRSSEVFSAHTPFELSVETKSGVFLGNLCVYFEGLPVLDQLFALTLYVESGQEELILEKANFFGVTLTRAEVEALQLKSEVVKDKVMPKKMANWSLEDGLKKHIVELTEPAWLDLKNPVAQWVKAWIGAPLRSYNAWNEELMRALAGNQDMLRNAQGETWAILYARKLLGLPALRRPEAATKAQLLTPASMEMVTMVPRIPLA